MAQISNNDVPEWDPLTQIYKDGIVPAHHSMSMSIKDLLDLNQGKLKIFGYGSLCWNPGTEGVLSLANIEEDVHDQDESATEDGNDDNVKNKSNKDECNGHGDAVATVKKKKPKRKVTTTPGRAIGYQRCWAQRSADHRGTPQFNGIVCTLLSDEEVWKLRHSGSRNDYCEQIRPSMTEGLIYPVDADLVDDCLAELDFREKGVRDLNI